MSISPWISRFARVIPKGSCVLDLAAGGGRHSLFLLDQGHLVTAVDRETDRLTAYRQAHPTASERLEIIKADLEDGSAWPLGERHFDGVIVVNYLWRPLWPAILKATDLLLCDTFAVGQEAYGKPSNPDFLLEPGELLDVVAGHLHVVAYEQGRIESNTGTAVKQRIVAARDPLLALPSS